MLVGSRSSVCAPRQDAVARSTDEEMDTLLNATVLIEALSKSTEAHDRGKKSERYRQLESLTDYPLISQDKYHLEHYLRQPHHN